MPLVQHLVGQSGSDTLKNPLRAHHPHEPMSPGPSSRAPSSPYCIAGLAPSQEVCTVVFPVQDSVGVLCSGNHPRAKAQQEELQAAYPPALPWEEAPKSKHS
jgi:hypothetical protein